jgi:PKD repeat protein
MSRPSASRRLTKAIPAPTWVILAAILLAWSPPGGDAATSPSISGSTTCGTPGETVQLPVAFTNDGAVVALQFDLGLSGGAVAAPVTAGDAVTDHLARSNVLSSGALRVLVYSPTNAALGNGTLVTVPFTIPVGLTGGSLSLGFSGVVLANASGQKVTPGQATPPPAMVNLACAPLAVTAAADKTSGSAPLTVVFTATLSGGTPPYTFDWSFGDGTPVGHVQNPAHTYAANGSYPVSLTVHDGAGSTATDTHVRVDVGVGSGDYTIAGSLGIGTQAPARAMHLVGSNSVFRMDGSADPSAFMLVRTDAAWNPTKAFVLGVNATGANTGELIIEDLGATVTTPGTRRMTIGSTGVASFGAQVKGTTFTTVSSSRFKTNIQPLVGALGRVLALQGVSFDWKASGVHSIGLIAEDVAKVVPEAVEATGGTLGVDYRRLVAVLVEAIKEQQARILRLEALNAEIRSRLGVPPATTNDSNPSTSSPH